ncbi:Hypothetical protein, putative [Bodo saltans]|uniref:Calponin-homology (CH) domain-containing protein n=1 Tax=Bodo saltans TaxID=75058 RepID=A0A0S4JE31_BODSA|nr:Hypothetical protein, putative [Bodo saltans]|eukprot:CUG88419.1 Hypothetical protein, putative [Bodo saltans]
MYSRNASSSHGGGLAPPPQTASSAARQKAPRPTGRVELLEWVNQVCGTHYPSIECLRDGIAYLTLVEATVSKTEPLLSTTTSSASSTTRALAPPTVSLPRTSAARALIEKIDHHVSLADASSSSSSHHNSAALDPALDTIQTKERCERNFHLLQAMLRECLMDKSHGMAVDVKRLASGKLQEHMRLLQWSVGFVEQQFLLAEKASAKRQQQQTATAAGLSGGAARQSRAASRGDTTDRPSLRARSSGGGPPPTAAATHHRDPTEEITSGQGVRQQRTASASATVQRTSRNHALSVAKEQSTSSGASHDASSYTTTTTHTNKTSVVVETTTTAAVDSTLADLLREVEELEGQVWANNGASGNHNNNATTTTTSKEGGSVGSHLGANSLEDVREMLRERDVLWQTLVAAEAEVWRASHDWQQQNQSQARHQHDLDEEVGIHQKHVQSVVPSKLLRDLCALFDVSLPLSIE